jgi:hypothetical protein
MSKKRRDLRRSLALVLCEERLDATGHLFPKKNYAKERRSSKKFVAKLNKKLRKKLRVKRYPKASIRLLRAIADLIELQADR